MTVLTNQSIQLTYGNVLTLGNEQNLGLTAAPQFVQDGYGHSSPLALSTTTVNFIGTGGIVIPVGTTLERPNPVAIGTLRFNNEIGFLELWNGLAWLQFQTI